ncbi:D-alanyl-D-alanine carboxypeptidase/D-alanyl-D-alanine-endopeptidase [Trichothermofontia sichuanensis B231]|uniref:D-alanyl-D-alanine carboxypeptidase/D-alanyl-D-alanine endopeptidase n=1 Tax=Trichothermofontia sichuanensis TaxID=3045816 RepID=UPI002245FBF9|nr:D-alanyl-D-alanine carboxypeptidase/D-alanyl-D-alanine-endopeptidase [Trichothermofontia sichuanensis]UZQ54348.1 D-alanyl-D-alanine carboxypeptidase/D-alanyl-D-alanine-endopeptidase [Trichothermofontia sichuanensis B231]
MRGICGWLQGCLPSATLITTLAIVGHSGAALAQQRPAVTVPVRTTQTYPTQTQARTPVQPQAAHQAQGFVVDTVRVSGSGNARQPASPTPIMPPGARPIPEAPAQTIPIPVPPPEQPSPRPPIAENVCPPQLISQIAAVINSPRYAGSTWGVLVEPVTSPMPLYSHNADTYLIPASNNKLFTTAAALQIYNPALKARSASLPNTIAAIHRWSDNAAADTLFKQMGGSAIARDALAVLGVNPASFVQVDGSGLSRQNLATPTALVQTLKAMMTAPDAKLFRETLPVAGVSGTLRNRLQSSPARGRVHAKTGTLRGVRALSGYIDGTGYGTVAFSILANHPSQDGTALVSGIDHIATLLTQVTPCR